MPVDSAGKTILITLGIAVVCSVLVSSTAVSLKNVQEEKARLDRLKNILVAGSLYTNDKDVPKVFEEKIQPVMVDLATGTIIPKEQWDDKLNPEKFTIKTMAEDQKYGRALPPEHDLAKLRRIPTHMPAYLVKEGDGIGQVVLVIYGKGLWSTMYGLVSIDKDAKTVRGLTFYEHGETPGLGGEVDNPLWKALWPGKKIFDNDWKLRIHVSKGSVDSSDPSAAYTVDGLSGATMTTRGVDQLIKFWMGDNGYGSFLAKARKAGLGSLKQLEINTKPLQ